MKKLYDQLNRLCGYVSGRADVLDHYGDFRRDDAGHMIPVGIVVAASPETIEALTRHAARHYPSMAVTAMTAHQYKMHARI